MSGTSLGTETYRLGTERFRGLIDGAIAENLRPPPRLTLSQWAERYAVLSAETSAQTGRFRAYAYQIGMMDAITDPSVEIVTVKKSARVGYTKLLDHVIGYFIHQDPSPMIVVQPRVEDAEDYSETEIAPMLRDTPVLRDITGDIKSRDSKQKRAKRVFRNGASVSFIGANSPAGFRRVTARIVMFDEVNGYPVTGAGKEGNQIRLGMRRAQTFWNSKFIIGSTPTIKGESEIEKWYAESDQRRFYIPCPHCGTMQVLEWGGEDTAHGIKWDKDEAGNHLLGTAHYVCSASGCVIAEVEKPGMLARGEWRATAPFHGNAGFHIWTGYSLDPKANWNALVKEWLEVKDHPLDRQTFINTVLGEDYEDRGDRALTENRLLARCEHWPVDIVPDGVAIITAGIDTQDDRVEIEIVGWGRNEESWSIAYELIAGDPGEPEFWKRVDAYLLRTWYRADGRPFTLEAACIDSGGHHAESVYAFAKERAGRLIWAIRGKSEQGGQRSPVWPTAAKLQRSKSKYRPVMLGVNAAKDLIRNWLHMDQHGPGYMHFPADRDRSYFAQMIAERSVTKFSGGRRFRIWELPNGRANEALDCRVYAYAALAGLLHFGLRLNRKADDVGAAYAAKSETLPKPGTAPAEIAPSPAPVENVIKVGEPATTPKKSLGAMLARGGR